MTAAAFNWHPWTNNPLDYIGRILHDESGHEVVVSRGMRDFVIAVDGAEDYRTETNAMACHRLNQIGATP